MAASFLGTLRKVLFGSKINDELQAIKRHISGPVKKAIERGDYNFDKGKVVEGAVIGLADIMSSTAISNAVDLESDFHLKQEFLRAAARRAEQYEVSILNHTGDGFLFIANDQSAENWQKQLILFSQSLISDFNLLLQQPNMKSGQQVESGLRFGVSCGRIMLGCLGASPIQFTAVGPDVNLAARLCTTAEKNEVVFSGAAWRKMNARDSYEAHRISEYAFKGFKSATVGVHLSSVCLNSGRSLSQVETLLLNSFSLVA